ncbi:hypothetical protein ACIRO3_33525 [Streptomyces sp. NPDC102278]|uniref:hypothetical protein n=1 Tax=Streptomyces sp. NPDC102278 TaxID=3366152 RepID=UPI0037FD70E7
MPNIWVLTNVPGGWNQQVLVRADAITYLRCGPDKVTASTLDAEASTTLVESGSSATKRPPLPQGFHIAFLQQVEDTRRDDFKLDKVITAELDPSDKWKWTVKDLEDM